MFHQFTQSYLNYTDNNTSNGLGMTINEDLHRVNAYIYYYIPLDYLTPSFQNNCMLQNGLQLHSVPYIENQANALGLLQQDSDQIQQKNNKLQTQKISKENDSKNKQKFGRNIQSNIFHLMVNFVSSDRRRAGKIEKIIQQHSMGIKPNQFYKIMKKMKSKLSNYATSSQIKQFVTGSLWKDESNGTKYEECSKIFRIIGKLYLQNHHLPYVYHSNKIKKESKKLHVCQMRKMRKSMN